MATAPRNGSPSPMHDRTPEPSTTSTDFGPDRSSFFLVRRATSDRSVSPRPPSLQHTKQKSARSQKSASSREKRARAPSIASSTSTNARYQTISKWNTENFISDASPSPFEHYNPRHPVDPPRPPRKGLEWVWFPYEGYWAEREVRNVVVAPRGEVDSHRGKQRWWRTSPNHKKSKSSGSAISQTPPPPPMGMNVPLIKIGSILVPKSRTGSEAVESRKGTKACANISSGKITAVSVNKFPPSAESPVSSQEPEEELLGLYCRAKKNVKKVIGASSRLSRRGKQTPSESLAENTGALKSPTTMLLEDTTSYFDKLQADRRLMPKRPQIVGRTPPTPGSVISSTERRYGLAPWHRRHSIESLFSISSSVHKILMGKTPTTTPPLNTEEPLVSGSGEFQSSDHDVNRRVQLAKIPVDISGVDSNDLSFLPTEAQRLNTPPTVRGLFFDLAAPKDGSDSDSHSAAISSVRSAATGRTSAKSKDSSTREWWDKNHHSNKSSRHSPEAKSFRAQVARQPIAHFELNVPEHYPSSPLCPKNPIHLSGGSVICPFHGRKMSVRLKKAKRADTGSSEADEKRDAF